jgi:hypothetical protein
MIHPPACATGKKLGLLRTLAERMQNYGVGEDVRLIAAVILETAREMDWAYDPEGANAWLAQLAVELAQSSPRKFRTGPPRRSTLGAMYRPL